METVPPKTNPPDPISAPPFKIFLLFFRDGETKVEVRRSLPISFLARAHLAFELKRSEDKESYVVSNLKRRDGVSFKDIVLDDELLDTLSRLS